MNHSSPLFGPKDALAPVVRGALEQATTKQLLDEIVRRHMPYADPTFSKLEVEQLRALAGKKGER